MRRMPRCCDPVAPTSTSTSPAAGSTCDDPDGAVEGRGRGRRGDLGRDGAHPAGHRRRDALARRRRHRVGARHPGPHARRGRLRRRRAERRLRRRCRAGARRRQLLPRLRRPVRLPHQPRVPARRGPSATPVPRDIRTVAPTARLTASSSTPTRRARRCRAASISRLASATPPSGTARGPAADRLAVLPVRAASPRSSATTGDPTLEPSPFFTTMNGYAKEHRTHG